MDKTVASPSRPHLPEAGMIIDGKAATAVSGRMLDVEDPADGSLLTRVPEGNGEDIGRAVAAARKAFEGSAWSRMRLLDRGRILERIAQKLEDHADDLAMLESFDNGKPATFARQADLVGAIDAFRYMSGWCTKIAGDVIPVAADARAIHAYTTRDPVGVVGAIVPWNFPLAMASFKTASALAAGCTMVLKPSELTPLTALRLGEIALEAGLPEGVLNVVCGHGREAGRALVNHRGVDKISFTGSTEVGRSIVHACANDFKRVTLELGGKSPSIIFADADLEKAIPGCAMAIFFNSGQVCIAASRLYVHEDVLPDVVEGLRRFTGNLVIGHGRDPATIIGPLVSGHQQSRVLDYIRSGVEDGGEILIGGGSHGSTGYFVEPTILTNIPPDARINQEEVFGPVLIVTPFRDEDDVVAMANDTRYGLAASLWTRDVSRAHRVARRLQAGNVAVNAHGLADPASPFGGMKQSGWGREMGRDGVLAFTETKTISILLD